MLSDKDEKHCYYHQAKNYATEEINTLIVIANKDSQEQARYQHKYSQDLHNETAQEDEPMASSMLTYENS
jgi:hypothetical protein